MYTYQALVAYLLVAAAATGSARSIDTRQIGGISCNIARFQILQALGDTKDATGQIQDAAVQNATTTGLDQADAAIKTIASALLSGETAPADARDEVAAGLTAAFTALEAGDATDTAVTDAQTALDKAVKAGQDVVDKC
ncbi:uncharacterized protein BCR38DRAFT_479346 [Pseudomassariella vexata]|uniref:Hydrophobic surface binding protein A-domain-containing protein n=1 Tax=Pseudomassariella vexata TaxID=1141098 RepID=A0A1Y2D6C7_9PEZI|nr:uncharacterized protein BCR38DRAFT_479346 [Pseudomassariella vexata]ORY54704.1 hypothetical protein BCR38DRAFT_479346 [Pseudomassariella vexata]